MSGLQEEFVNNHWQSATECFVQVNAHPSPEKATQATRSVLKDTLRVTACATWREPRLAGTGKRHAFSEQPTLKQDFAPQLSYCRSIQKLLPICLTVMIQSLLRVNITQRLSPVTKYGDFRIVLIPYRCLIPQNVDTDSPTLRPD